MQGECLGGGATALYAAKVLHSGVPAVVECLHALTHVAVARLVFALEHRLDVHPVSGVEHLRLLASHHLEVVELESASKSAPCVKH